MKHTFLNVLFFIYIIFMPFTPLHFGVALPFIFWDWKKKRINAISALLGTVVVDVRATYLFLFTNNANYHGILHSFFSATILGILVGIFVHLTEKYWNMGLKLLKWEQRTSLLSKILISILFCYSHIILDGAMYPEMNPLWPFLSGNFLYEWIKVSTIIDICMYGYLIGIIFYFSYLMWKSKIEKRKAI